MFEQACSKILPSLWFVIPARSDGVGAFDWRYGGTAFAVNSDGLLFTSAHVTYVDVEQRTEADRLFVARPDLDFPDRRFSLQEALSARLIAKDETADTAILQIQNPRSPVPHVRLIPDAPAVGSPCMTLGYSAVHGTPDTGFSAYARGAYGMVSTAPYPFSDNGGESRQIQEADMIVHPGGSGGPVFLQSGVVFGAVRGSIPHTGRQQVGIENLTAVTGVRSLAQLLDIQSAGLEFVHRRRWWGGRRL